MDKRQLGTSDLQITAIGFGADTVKNMLVDRGLIEEAGRDEGPGRPLLYATTPAFLERLGLPSLAALPSLAPLLDAAAAPSDAADLAADGPPEGDEAAVDDAPEPPDEPET